MIYMDKQKDRYLTPTTLDVIYHFEESVNEWRNLNSTSICSRMLKGFSFKMSLLIKRFTAMENCPLISKRSNLEELNQRLFSRVGTCLELSKGSDLIASPSTRAFLKKGSR